MEWYHNRLSRFLRAKLDDLVGNINGTPAGSCHVTEPRARVVGKIELPPANRLPPIAQALTPV